MPWLSESKIWISANRRTNQRDFIFGKTREAIQRDHQMRFYSNNIG